MLSLLAALLLATAFEPAAPAPTPAPTPAASPAKAAPAPLPAAQAVDANGVPAWAKRKRKTSVQNCETLPGIGMETWRQGYDPQGTTILKPRPPQTTCHH
jgi:hypothetical protein